MPSQQKKHFNDVLREAMEDFQEHGYDTPERLEHWDRLLRQAAVASMIPETQLDATLREHYAQIYRREVERGGALRRHPGVQRWVLDRIKPGLRDILSARVMASAKLIKLNREQEVDATMRRFAGYVTSIPPGGTDVPGAGEEAKKIRSTLAGLSFRERRVMVDQGHKLVANISAVVAEGGGAIAARWRSHWRQANYDYRKDHKARDGVVYLVRGSWALEKGLIKPAGRKYTDQVTQPGEEVFCFPGDSKVPFADAIEVAYRRRYDGELTTLVTESGKTLRATPNHPILTPDGWIPIGALNEGDQVIEIADDVPGAVPAEEDRYNSAVPTIEQVYGAAVKLSANLTVPGKVDQFHGDGSDGDVDVVLVAGRLSVGGEPFSEEGLKKFYFPVSSIPFAFLSSLERFFIRGFSAATSIVSGLRKTLATFFTFKTHPVAVAFGDRTYLNPGSDQDYLDHLGGRSVLPGDKDASFPGLVFPHQRVRVKRLENSHFAGHVYNLQTKSGLYVTEGIVSSNCRCNYEYIYSLRRLPEEMLTQKGQEELKRVRAQLAAA